MFGLFLKLVGTAVVYAIGSQSSNGHKSIRNNNNISADIIKRNKRNVGEDTNISVIILPEL